jgi:hypothetical protein
MHASTHQICPLSILADVAYVEPAVGRCEGHAWYMLLLFNLFVAASGLLFPDTLLVLNWKRADGHEHEGGFTSSSSWSSKEAGPAKRK